MTAEQIQQIRDRWAAYPYNMVTKGENPAHIKGDIILLCKEIDRLGKALTASESWQARAETACKICGICRSYSHSNVKCEHDYAGQAPRAPQSKCEHPEAGWRKVAWL